MGYAQEAVEVARSAQPVVGLVDGVEEVDKDNGDVDTSAVLVVEGGTRLGFGVAGADHDAVVDGLKPSCYELLRLANSLLNCFASKTYVGEKGPAGVGEDAVKGDGGGCCVAGHVVLKD